MCRIGGRKRINVTDEHFALSAPRQTTAPVTAETKFDFARAAAVLTDAAARAGAAIMTHYHEGPEVTFKDDLSPVTRADHEAEAIIIAALKKLTPDIPVVSEEASGGKEFKLGARFFLVDPLDGTKEFIKKRSDFTVNIALIVDGRPRFGLVYAPAQSLLAVTVAVDKAVEAELAPNESGADLAKLVCRPLHVRAPGPEGYVAVVSHSHLDADTEAFLAKLKITKRSSAGSSLKFLLVARGEADVYPRFGPTMEWDIAAGQAVLEAAGGAVVEAGGARLRYGKTEARLRNPSFIAWGRRG
jgi:3'(2'), 5'-bisphosphate nucleotidase